jgi:hypothetical protein
VGNTVVWMRRTAILRRKSRIVSSFDPGCGRCDGFE